MILDVKYLFNQLDAKINSPIIKNIMSTDVTYSALSNSEKCCAATRDVINENFCYILRAPEKPNGIDIAIETHYGNENTLKKGAAISVSLPFRIPIADESFLNSLSFSDQPKENNALLWNPGLTVNDNVLSPALPSPAKWYEINLSRNQLYQLNNKRIALYKNFSIHNIEYCDVKSVIANVVDPKMVVDHNGETDNITLAYNARVDISGRFFYIKDKTEVTTKNGTIFFTVPFVVKFSVNKSQLKILRNVAYNNFWWTYGINPKFSINDIKSINSLNGAIDTKSYDFNIIPHMQEKTKIKDTVGRFNVVTTGYRIGQYPSSLWSKVDVAYDKARSITVIGTAIGKFSDSNRIRSYVNVSAIEFADSYGFKIPVITDEPHYTQLDLSSVVSSLSMAINGDTLLIGVGRESGSSTLQNSVIFSLYSLSSGLTKNQFYSTYNSLTDVVVCSYLNKFLCSYYNTADKSSQISLHPVTISSNKVCDGRKILPTGASYITSFARTVGINDLYPEIVNGITFYISKSRNKEMFLNIADTINRISKMIPRPLNDGVIALDISNESYAIKNVIYDSSSDGSESLRNINNDLYTINDDNESNYADYFYIKHKSYNSFWVTDQVKNYKVEPIDISNSTIVPEYWSNPEFSKSEATTNNEGVKLIIDLVGCSGLYTASDISGGDKWDINARPAMSYNKVIHGGIPLDPERTRNDIDYIYGGTEAGYKAQQPPGVSGRFGGSYTLTLLNSAAVRLTYKDKDILYGMGSNKYSYTLPVCWKYNNTGLFNMYLDVRLVLDGLLGDDNVSYFTDDGFKMSGCKLSLTLYNKYKVPIASFKDRLVDIIPPSANGTVSSQNGYKTINNISFNMHRDVDPSSSRFTTIRNVKFNFYDHSKNLVQSYLNSPSNFYDNSNDGAKYDTTLAFDDKMKLDKGDYVYVTYEPRINDSKSKSVTTQSSEIVNYVKGHKFSISDVVIEFKGNNGLYSDVTSIIANGNSIHYSSINELDVRVSYSCSCEQWSNRENFDKINVYPYIKKMYMFASKGITQYSSRGDGIIYEELPIGANALTTYPNHTDAFSSILKQKYNDIQSNSSNLVSLINTNSTVLTDFVVGAFNHEITISLIGQYQLYLIIEDEFGQLSCSCLTNILDKYRIPFRRI